MHIETKYNIGDVIHQVCTAPADPDMQQYQDEHYYCGHGRIKSICVSIGHFGDPTAKSVCYQRERKLANGKTSTTPVQEEDAFPTREAAEAEVKRRKRSWEPD